MSSFLQHALSTREPFGLITAMLSPIAAGGRIVMLKQFDTIQVWSHILGIVVNHPQPLPKVDLVRTNCHDKDDEFVSYSNLNPAIYSYSRESLKVID